MVLPPEERSGDGVRRTPGAGASLRCRLGFHAEASPSQCRRGGACGRPVLPPWERSGAGRRWAGPAIVHSAARAPLSRFVVL